MMLNNQRTLFVLAAQDRPPDPGSMACSRRCVPTIGDVGRFAQEPDGKALFICRDNTSLRCLEAVRNLVAKRIVGHVSERLTHIDSIAVVIHKTDPGFVYAMMGLVDELRKEHWFNVRIVVGIDSGNGLSARGAVLDCVENFRRRDSGEPLPALVNDFDPKRLLDYNDVFTPVSSDN